MNPLALAHDAHEIISTLITGQDAICMIHRTEYLIKVDNILHEIISDYERRGMEYDGPSS